MYENAVCFCACKKMYDKSGPHSVKPVGSEKFWLFVPIGPWPATAGHGQLRVGRVGPAFGPVDFAANPCLITCLLMIHSWYSRGTPPCFLEGCRQLFCHF